MNKRYSAAAKAARLKAPFQSRSSNIGITPLDAPGVDPGRYLVVYRARPPGDLLGPDALPSLLPYQHHLVPDLDISLDPEQAGVHRHPSQQGTPLSPNERLRPVREEAAVSLGIPDRHRRREHRLLGPERQPVRDPLTGREAPDIRHIALERERGPQVLVGGIALVPRRMQAIEGHAGADAVVVGGGSPEDAGGVGCMHEDATEVLHGQHLVEDFELATGCPFVGVCRGEVGVDPDELYPEDLSRLSSLVRLDAPAVHAGVDLEVGFEAGICNDALRARNRVGRDLETVLSSEGEPIREEVGEDEYRDVDACSP